MTTPTIDNGGPAFPHQPAVNANGEYILYGDCGMNLRAYLAAKALSGLCSNATLFTSFQEMRPEMLKVMTAEQCDEFEHKVIAKCSVSLADALIAELNTASK